jgi:hypothetical protein
MKLRHTTRYWIAVLILLAGPPSALLAQAISPEQVVSIEQVGAVALSPDGGLIAYTVTKPRGEDDGYGRPYSELWVVPADR